MLQAQKDPGRRTRACQENGLGLVRCCTGRCARWSTPSGAAGASTSTSTQRVAARALKQGREDEPVKFPEAHQRVSVGLGCACKQGMQQATDSADDDRGGAVDGLAGMRGDIPQRHGVHVPIVGQGRRLPDTMRMQAILPLPSSLLPSSPPAVEVGTALPGAFCPAPTPAADRAATVAAAS